jgi:hypothetical protein
LADLYREHRVFGHNGEAMVIRVCFERLSDGQFAVAHTEFVREDDHLGDRMIEIGNTTAELLVDPDQPSLWDFRSSLQDAISAHDDVFSEFVERIQNAQH